MVEGRTVTAGIMFAIFAGMVGTALIAYEGETRMMPLVIGVPGLILAGIQFGVELFRREHEVVSAEDRRALFGMFGWFVAFVAAIVSFGFVYTGPVMVGLYLRLSWQEKWRVCLTAVVLAWAVLYGVFERFLGLALFEGLIPRFFAS